MTEAEWMTATDPTPMLEFLRDKATDRKLRLFAVACCRRVWHLIPEGASKHAVEVAERYADRLVGDRERSAAHRAKDICNEAKFAVARSRHFPNLVSRCATHCLMNVASQPTLKPVDTATKWEVARNVEGTAHAGFVRDIFGNPFRPVTLDHSWLTSTVVQLATGIYADRAFDGMPILADALQDAGCDNDDILNHLRDPNTTHVRGCWALDLVLGKS